jgi:phosphoserine aminotransferase
MRKLFFTPGPSELYFTTEHHMKMAFQQGIPSISHRSEKFQSIFEESTNNLRELLALPDDYHIVFTTSATEVWERSAENLIDKHALHFVNGAFSKKFYEAVEQLGYKTTLYESPWGTLPDIYTVPEGDYDFIGITHNETSTGVSFPLNHIKLLRQQFPEAILAVDAVSSLPNVDFNYSEVDMVYVSVQKCFGLPAGLGVWLMNDRCIEKAQKLEAEGKTHRTYHSISSLIEQAKKHQTPSTPNVLNIYLLGKVVEDMLNRGIGMIRNETVYKSAILYNMLDRHTKLTPYVSDPKLRSNTVIVIESGDHTADLMKSLAAKHMIVGTGYGSKKDTQVRIANFPTHSKEQFEMLTDLIEQW